MTTTYLVTGGAGFIGSHVVDALLARGDSVVCLDNFNDYYDPTLKRANVARHLLHDKYRLVEGDIRDGEKVSETLDTYRPQTIIHLAACAGVRPSFVDPFKYQSVNLQGTLTLLDAAAKQGVEMFVNASSSSVYGENTKAPFVETDALLTPNSAYAATKLGAEGLTRVYARQYPMRAVSLRFFTVYGPRQRPDMAITKFATKMLQGKPLTIYGDGSARRDFTFVYDIVDGILASSEYTETKYEAFNLGSGSTVTLNELIAQLEQTLGVSAQRIHAGDQPGDVPLTYSCIQKAGRLLGYRPKTTLNVGLRHVARFLRSRLPVTRHQPSMASLAPHRGAREENAWGQSTTA